MENEKPCCKAAKKKGVKAGIINGLIPHIGCIAFVIFAAIGATAAASFVKPLLLSSYLFYGLIALSLLFATISAVFYLKRNNSLSLEGVKSNKSYLSILYGTTIAVNLLFFFVIFPMTANLTGSAVKESEDKLTLQVNIPCSGHASLIISELNNAGISAKFRAPNYFDITYDSSKIAKEDVLNLDIFKTFKAEIV